MNEEPNDCSLCSEKGEQINYTVSPEHSSYQSTINICTICNNQLTGESKIDPNHWRCLNDSMWSEDPATKVIAWRMLTQLKEEGWPIELLDMLYLEDELLNWAKEGLSTNTGKVIHKDSNGNILMDGDSIVLTKGLDVKGANFTAKRGTSVRNIRLIVDNAEQVEGKVNGQQIVILTKFVKKS